MFSSTEGPRRISPRQLMVAEVEYKYQMRNSYFWASVHAVFLSLILWSYCFTEKDLPFFMANAQLGFGCFILINFLFHFGRVFWIRYKLTEQSKLKFLKFEGKPDTSCAEEKDFSCYQRSNLEIVMDEERKEGRMKCSPPLNGSWGRNTSISSEKDVKKFLKDYAEAEKSLLVANSAESPNSLVGGFWGSMSLTPMDVSPILRRTMYQTSPLSVDYTHKSDENGSPMFKMYSDFWRRHRVNPAYLINWVSNLRMWIASTILHRIVDEINVIDSGLKSQGISGVSIGKVALDTLTNTANNAVVGGHVPTLAYLIPFLQASTHQSYVVQRIKELAVGSSMNDYKWKSGGKIDGKDWEPYLPTDAQLIMHLICTYLDSQLPILPNEPDARPFTTQYFAKGPDKPKQTQMAIMERSMSPPHYQVYIDDELQDIPLGRNNMFYSVILFLYHIRKNHQGMLGRISLGRCGVNMLWIVDNDNLTDMD